MGISCIVHTFNSEATLERALKSAAWVDELIVVDMESEDATREIAGTYADTILTTGKTPRVDGIRNTFLDKAAHEWILVLDSDEYLADDAEQTTWELLDEYGKSYDAFAIPRFNYIAGQIMRGSGWYPDHQIRLFRKGTVRWTDANHVVPTVTTGPRRLMTLTPPGCMHIHHRNYENLRHFIKKQVDYALSNRYDPDPSKFDFSDYIARAHRNLALRSDTENDGDLSHALALIMAWDAIVQGLIHWDSLEPRPPLRYLTALPVATSRLFWLEIKLRKWMMRHYPMATLIKGLAIRAKRMLSFLPGKKSQ
jgi:glycosyltransferase involved in cell wall biosynthesis